jgi:hypothetical protein
MDKFDLKFEKDKSIYMMYTLMKRTNDPQLKNQFNFEFDFQGIDRAIKYIDYMKYSFKYINHLK